MKTYALATTDEALDELQAALDYYGQKSENLDLQFADALTKQCSCYLSLPTQEIFATVLFASRG